MLRIYQRTAIAALAAVAVVSTCDLTFAQYPGYGSGGQNVFYNYYVGQSAYGGMPAQLYTSPRPTPPLVGHTYITYPPLMPHEYLYSHNRTYRTRHPGGGYTRTRVKYRGSGGAHTRPVLYPFWPRPVGVASPKRWWSQ